MGPAEPCTSHSSFRQFRQMIIFSKKKKNIIPPKTTNNIPWGSPPELSIASGINPNKAAVSNVPVAYEIKIVIDNFCACLFRRVNDAAANIAPTLPKILNNIIQRRIFTSLNVIN